MNTLASPRMLLAIEAWGTVPRWVEVLIKACDAKGSSQGKVAKRLGYSATVVSQIIHKSYPSIDDALETRILDIFDGQNVKCPARGLIRAEECVKWRDKASELHSSSPIHVQMFVACNTCERFKGKEEA